MRFLIVTLAAMLLAPCAGAETVHKCFDANGRVTYQSQSCASSHLKEGGQIEPAAEVPPEEAAQAKAQTEKTRARLEADTKARKEAEAKVLQQEREERRVQALERQARAAEEQARAAEREAEAAEAAARAPFFIAPPRRFPPGKHRPEHKPSPSSQRCAPGDRSCR